MIHLQISKDSSKTPYATIGAALAALPEDKAQPVILTLDPGIYEEVVEIRRSHVTLRGQGKPEDTVIQFGNYANMKMEDGSKRGTFRSYTMLLDGDGITLENLTVRNTAFPRSKVAQALALYADGDGILVKNCRLESFQDTLFTGPLPPTPNIPGSFVGPKEFDERRVGRQIYENCVITGDVEGMSLQPPHRRDIRWAMSLRSAGFPARNARRAVFFWGVPGEIMPRPC